MTKLQQEVIDHLFTGGYLMKRDRRGSHVRYTLYKGNASPVRIYEFRTVKPILQICKKNDKDQHTLNLNLVRQHRGNSYIKQLYNALKQDAAMRQLPVSEGCAVASLA